MAQRQPWAARTTSSPAPTPGATRAAILYTLIETAKLNGLDPQASLANIIGRITNHPAKRINELLPWNWRAGEHRQVT